MIQNRRNNLGSVTSINIRVFNTRTGKHEDRLVTGRIVKTETISRYNGMSCSPGFRRVKIRYQLGREIVYRSFVINNHGAVVGGI